MVSLAGISHVAWEAAVRTWPVQALERAVVEARKGRMPDKIVMEQVTRRFAPPDKVAQGHVG